MGLDLIIMVMIIVGRLLRESRERHKASAFGARAPSCEDIKNKADTHFRAERFDDAGYPTATPAGAWSPAHQKYTSVQI